MISKYLVVRSFREVEADALAVPVFKGACLREAYPELDALCGGALGELGVTRSFKGGVGEAEVVYVPTTPFRKVIVVGCGDVPVGRHDFLEAMRCFGGAAVTKAMRLGVSRLALVIPENLPPVNGVGRAEVVRAVAEGAELANYVWARKSSSENLPTPISEVFIAGFSEVRGWRQALREAAVIGEACRLGRDLANAPASEVNPDTFPARVEDAFKELPVRVEVLDEGRLKEEGLNGVLAVGSGSARRPRLLIIEYAGGGEGLPWYVVVGKGVCFDAGGLDLKQARSMEWMKYDKSGAAYAVAVAYAAAKLGLKLNLAILTPLVENLPSGASYKPRDIVRMYNGVTVEVVNTDAEGRLILADTIAYAVRRYSPKAVVDLATLTGGVVVALGCHAAGLFTNNDVIRDAMLEASKETGERVWPLPLWREYYRDIESEVADLKNVGYPGTASPIIGAAFLSRFAGNTPWAHLDIAGVAKVHEEGPRKPYYSAGGSGGATCFGVRLVLNFLIKLAGYGRG